MNTRWWFSIWVVENSLRTLEKSAAIGSAVASDDYRKKLAQMSRGALLVDVNGADSSNDWHTLDSALEARATLRFCGRKIVP